MERAHYKTSCHEAYCSKSALPGRCRRESCGRPPAFHRVQALRQGRRQNTSQLRVFVFASLVIPRALEVNIASARGRGPDVSKNCLLSIPLEWRLRASPSEGHNGRALRLCGSRWRRCPAWFRHLSRNSVTAVVRASLRQFVGHKPGPATPPIDSHRAARSQQRCALEPRPCSPQTTQKEFLLPFRPAGKA